MSKRKVTLKKDHENFGNRMARLRQTAGYSQRELAAEIGISQRMVAYYEKETDYPPTHLLPLLAKTLAVSADLLLGVPSQSLIVLQVKYYLFTIKSKLFLHSANLVKCM